MILNEIRVDSARVEEGEWIKNIPDMGELELHVRGIGNSDFLRMQSKLYQATPRAERVGGLAPKTSALIQAKCLAATVLLGWKGMYELVTDAKGAPVLDDAGVQKQQEVEYSKELASKLLQNPDYVAFRDGVVWAANQVGTNRAEDVEEVAKNSETPSAGI